MEPQWTKAIASATVCNYFYVLFCVSAFTLVLSVISALGLFGKQNTMLVVNLFLTSLFSSASTLGYYLICSRGLLESKSK